MLLLTLLLACDSVPPPPTPEPLQRYTPTTTVTASAGQKQPTEVAAGAMRNVVVVIIDTLRDDALTRASTPNLDGLRAGGAQRTWAWAPSTWTAPSVVSLFTGMSVRQHGWDFPFPKQMETSGQTYPPIPAVPLLAEVFDDAGFRTTGLYGNRLLGQGLGYGRGFDRWEWGDDATLVRLAGESISAWRDDQRNFLYLHLMGPHHPLAPSERSRSHWGMTRKDLGRDGAIGLPEVREGGALEETLYFRAYHAAIEDTDERLGLLLRALRPVLGQTAVVVTSDHGELLGEHALLGHQEGVWEPLTRVPFIALNTPQLPTLVPVEGVAALVSAAAGIPHDWVTAIDFAGPLVSQREGSLALTEDGLLKGVWDAGIAAEPVAFDLASDPGEEQAVQPLPVALSQARRSWEASVPTRALTADEGAMSDELVQALEELGYLTE